jgi:AraC family transcriptional regulator, transcriptional activator of the genes for pyochelin and ferripyochelin receptors
MNKIVTRDWMKSFGHIDQQLVHGSDRYFEVTTEVVEPRLASGSSWTIGMPGLTLDNVVIRPENKLIIGDLTEKENIQSVYVISGQADSTFDFGNKLAVMEKSRHAFQYSSGYEAEHKIIASHFHALSIDIHPDFFKSLMTTNEGDVNEIYNSFNKGESLQSVLMLQPRMQEIINYILLCPFKGVTRYLFIESKVLELLALQIDQINSSKSIKQLQSNADIDKLLATKDFIEHNYLEPLSLAGLCKTFSLNEFKLKKGYKELFHTTVFGHINSLRMEKAREFLSKGHMNVSEIANFIGYKNIGSFSAEFKKRFGYAPSKYQR